MKKTTQDTEIFSVSVRIENGEIIVSANLGEFDSTAGVTGYALADAFGRASADLNTSFLAIVDESGLDRQKMAAAMGRACERHIDAIYAAAAADDSIGEDPETMIQ